MVSLREKFVAKKSKSENGFRFPSTPVLFYNEADSFRRAIREQSDHLALVDAKPLGRVDIEGRVHRTDWHLSSAAFSDVCHYSRVPVRFIKDMAKHNETLALDVVQEMVQRHLQTGQEKVLVLDTRNGRIEGIVGRDTYSPIAHPDVVDFTFAANPALQFTNGWLAGPHMRMTTVSDRLVKEAQKGDVVKMGVSIENSLNGDSSARFQDYVLRLVCTNGMTSTENHGWNRVVHQGDVEYKVQEAVVQVANRVQRMLPIIQASTRNLMDDKGIRSIRRFMADEKIGGSLKLSRRATREAMRDAVANDGREEDELTLWNFTNGITATAHEEKSIKRVQEIEAFGYRTLHHFGAAMVN